MKRFSPRGPQFLQDGDRFIHLSLSDTPLGVIVQLKETCCKLLVVKVQSENQFSQRSLGYSVVLLLATLQGDIVQFEYNLHRREI